MIKSEATTVVNRPVEQVFLFATSFEDRPKWCTGTLESKRTSTGPVGVGATFREVFQLFLGLRGKSDYKVTQYEPNRRFEFVSTSGSLQVKEQLTFEPVEGGARITQTTETDFNRLRFIEPFFQGMGQRMLTTNLTKLKAQLEK